jgi:hypothetical protein
VIKKKVEKEGKEVVKGKRNKIIFGRMFFAFKVVL